MPTLSYKDQCYDMQSGETVLDCLLRHQQSLSHSCKSGVCQACLVQAVESDVPSKAQQGLKTTLQASQHGLACQWVPEANTRIRECGEAAASIAGDVCELTPLNNMVMRLRVRMTEALACEPGQYLNLINANGVVRSYSVANDPAHDGYAEFHIARTTAGLFTTWLFQDAKLGDQLQMRGPVGNCFYVPSATQEEPLLLAGLGTGLAPLYGIVNAALKRGHRGPITLIHGAAQVAHLYYQQELMALAEQYQNFTYSPVVLEESSDSRFPQGDAEQSTLSAVGTTNKAANLVFLCGNPGFVQRLRKQVFLRGVKSANIYCDPFIERATA
jgi:CDP-4-dehydro-6-deoxyglucose reductase, E3